MAKLGMLRGQKKFLSYSKPDDKSLVIGCVKLIRSSTKSLWKFSREKFSLRKNFEEFSGFLPRLSQSRICEWRRRPKAAISFSIPWWIRRSPSEAVFLNCQVFFNLILNLSLRGIVRFRKIHCDTKIKLSDGPSRNPPHCREAKI